MHPESLHTVYTILGLSTDEKNNELLEGCTLFDTVNPLPDNVKYIISEQLSIEELNHLEDRIQSIIADNELPQNILKNRNTQLSQLVDIVSVEIELHERIGLVLQAVNPKDEPYLRNCGMWDNVGNLVTKQEPGTLMISLLCFLAEYVQQVCHGTLLLPKSLYQKYNDILYQVGINVPPPTE